MMLLVISINEQAQVFTLRKLTRQITRWITEKWIKIPVNYTPQ